MNAGAQQMGIAPPPSVDSSAGPAVKLADSTILLPPDTAWTATARPPPASQLPFGDKDPYGDAAASRGGAMPASFQPHRGTQGYNAASPQQNEPAPGVFDTPGNASALSPVSDPPAASPDQAIQGSLSSADAASPTGAAAPLPAPQLDQTSPGGQNMRPAGASPTPSPDSQQAGGAPNRQVSIQPAAPPPVTISAQSDQEPLLKLYQDRADQWRKIAIAGI